MTLNSRLFAFQVRGVAHWTDINQRARQERTDEVDLDGEAAFNATVDDALDDSPASRTPAPDAIQRSGALGFFTGQARFAIAVFDAVERNLNVVTDVDRRVRQRSFLNCSSGMSASLFRPALTSTTSGTDFDHSTHEDGAWLDPLGCQAFFEHRRKTFGHEYFQGHVAAVDPAGIRSDEGLLHQAAHPAQRHET